MHLQGTFDNDDEVETTAVLLPREPHSVPHREAPAPATRAYKILSWNIYMLPRFATFTGKRRRSLAIAEELCKLDYDMIVFQEAFFSDARRILRKSLRDRYPYESGPANRGLSFRTNSGIWILCKHPFRLLDNITFTSHKGIDSMARKGATLIETDHQGITFQVLGTHLNAFSADLIRRRQCIQIGRMLQRNARPGVPQVLCGDMNVRKADTENYHHMLRTLAARDGEFSGPQQYTEDGLYNDVTMVPKDSRNVIDYILYRPNGREPARISRRIPVFRRRWSGSRLDLSDHYPVEVQLHF